MAMIVDALVSQFVETLATMAKEEVPMLLGAKDALRQLEEDVDVLGDAELRAFTDHAVRRWLADVKDLVCNADDIIDYSRTQAEKLSMLALRHRTGRSIRSVNERIRKRELGLKPRDRGSSVCLGIEKDTSSLAGLLTSRSGGPRITIVAITGMSLSQSRMGKTTLAQKICINKAIKDGLREPPPVWVCVSQQYTNESILSQCRRGIPEEMSLSRSSRASLLCS